MPLSAGAAARVVAALRKRAKEKSVHGDFDTLHVRRGDFQFKPTRVPVWYIYNKTKDYIPDGATLYIATDEKNKEWFDLMREHYDVVFLDDFMHELEGVNTNYYGTCSYVHLLFTACLLYSSECTPFCFRDD